MSQTPGEIGRADPGVESAVSANVVVSKPARVATFCLGCGKPIAGFSGVLACECGKLVSVSVMELS